MGKITSHAVLTGLLASSILAWAVVPQSKKSDRECEGLAGPVKSIHEETAKFSNKAGKWMEGTRSLSRKVAYDEPGYMTQEYTGGLAPYHVYGYARGDRLERQTRALTTTRPPTASDFGFQSDIWINTSFFRWVFKVDEKGNRIEEARYKRNDKRGRGTSIDLVDRTIHTYDGLGRKVETAVYASSGILVGRWLYRWDDSGKISEETALKRDGSVGDKQSYSYEVDSRGNWIKRTTSKWLKKDDKSSLEPVEITYRAVIYY